MLQPDDFSSYLAELLQGSYDCVDRIALRAYFRLGQTSGGLLTWWDRLFAGRALTQESLRSIAGDFARRVKAYGQKNHIPVVYCELGDKTKHARAERLRPRDPDFEGLFLILVARAPAPVWQIKHSPQGKLLVRRPKSWPLVNHYHFHLIDKQWGHITIRMSGHPPFGAQILLNGHEWLERQARQAAICYVKEANCFVAGSDLPALNRLAAGLEGEAGLLRLAQVCDRWIYSACLCFGLTRAEQERCQFRYAYSSFQLEYSRNLLFKSGRTLRWSLPRSDRSHSRSIGCSAAKNHLWAQAPAAEKPPQASAFRENPGSLPPRCDGLQAALWTLNAQDV